MLTFEWRIKGYDLIIRYLCEIHLLRLFQHIIDATYLIEVRLQSCCIVIVLLVLSNLSSEHRCGTRLGNIVLKTSADGFLSGYLHGVIPILQIRFLDLEVIELARINLSTIYELSFVS